jgi:cardiolipin synthase
VQPITNLLINLGWDLTWWTFLLGAAEVLALLTIPSVLIQRRGQPVAALAWAFGLVALPYAGVILWWGIGRSHLARKRRRKAFAHWKVSRGFASLRPRKHALTPEVLDKLLAIKRLPAREAIGVFPPVSGNSVEILPDGATTYAALERLIKEASHHLHFLFYTWEPDAVGARFRDLLVERARAGVQVRLLCDAVGSSALKEPFMDPLRAAGGKVAYFGRTRFIRRGLTVNFRNHRKMALADGRSAYMGGLNIGEAYTRDWRDLGLILKGPVVTHLQEVFADDWFFTTRENLAEPDYVPDESESAEAEEAGGTVCRIIAGGPDSTYNATHDAFFIAITQARKRIFISTPYLAPGQAIQAALRTAAYRGVDVRLLVPRRSDVPLARLAGRSYYPSLLAGGIRIFEYLPAILHGKQWIFDDDLSVVGSANLDNRSFKLNFEASCFVLGRDVNEKLADIFLEEQKDSEEVTRRDLAKVSRWQQLKEAAMNLFSPLL